VTTLLQVDGKNKREKKLTVKYKVAPSDFLLLGTGYKSSY